MRKQLVTVGAAQLRRWTGPAYHVDSGYSSRLSAAEEAEEFLRQQSSQEEWHSTLGSLIPYMTNIPQRDLLWVTRKKADVLPYAERYQSEIYKLDLPYAVIVGDDSEGGYLVIRDARRLKL